MVVAIIVATARQHNLTVVTTDRAWRHYPHAHVRYYKPALSPRV